MTDSSYRNNCDISFIRDNFRFREKPPSKSESWKFLSFILLLVVFFLINLKMRIHGAKLKYSRNYIDSFINGYTEKDMRSCAALNYEDRSNSMYLFFKTLSKEFHRRPDKKSSFVQKETPRALAQENREALETDDVEKHVVIRVNPTRTIKNPEDPIRSILLPVLIIGLLVALVVRAVWDVARSDVSDGHGF